MTYWDMNQLRLITSQYMKGKYLVQKLIHYLITNDIFINVVSLSHRSP